jgi:hypothetical protein
VLTPTITVHPRTLGAQEDGAVSYGRFRRFAILLPPERLTAMDPGVAWFEAATLMPPCAPLVMPLLHAALLRSARGAAVLHWGRRHIFNSSRSQCCRAGAAGLPAAAPGRKQCRSDHS